MLKLKRESYKPNLNCSLIVKAGPNYGLVAFIHKVKLRRYYSSEDVLKVIADNNRNTSLVWHGTNQEVSPKLSLFSSDDKGSIKISFASGNFKLMLSSKGLRIIFTIYQGKTYLVIKCISITCDFPKSLKTNSAIRIHRCFLTVAIIVAFTNLLNAMAMTTVEIMEMNLTVVRFRI